MADLFSLSGHAGYIWSAYAVTAVILLGLLGATLQQRQAARRAEMVLARVRRPRR